ncbi:MAG: glutamine--fructose-6-phosphate transaminase (isomerizing), partial [Chloroflexota bacterium]|nr:glutamine--fructose-6-phosphate transaminase (isomerizing) [Chloroflexota bacterium]
GHAGGIVVAHRDGQGIVGSDLPAALPILRQRPGPVAYLEPGEMAQVTRQGVEIFDLAGNEVQKEMRTVFPQDALVDRGGYRHFMLKEIMEQPQAVAGALRGRVNFDASRVELPDFPYSDEEIQEFRRVVVTGCGTSLNAALAGRYLIERFSGLPAEVESASEYRYREPYLDRQTLVVAISQSGETADTIAAMEDALERGARVLAICNVEESVAARLADGALLMGSGMEIGVASTKTFIASITILFLLAVYLGQARGRLSAGERSTLIGDLARCPRLIGEMLADVSHYRTLAQKFSGYNSFLYLGRGINSAIAQEGALKLKEISYIHAEGYPAGEMKHGPIALIDRNMATLALAPRDALYDKMSGNIREIRARRGVVLGVLTEGDIELNGEIDEALYLPEAPDYIYPLLATIPLQLLAYYIALDRGCDVDQPRNLAKSVTVE